MNDDTKKASEENVEGTFLKACRRIIHAFAQARNRFENCAAWAICVYAKKKRQLEIINIVLTNEQAEELKALHEACQYRPTALNQTGSIDNWHHRGITVTDLRKKEGHGEQQGPPGVPGQARDRSDPETRKPEAPRSLSSGF